MYHEVMYDQVLLLLFHRYFLVGPGSDKFRSVQSFISDMGFHSRHYDIIIAFDRNVIAKFQGRVLRYLTMSRKMITRQWVRYVVEGK